jgi:hypothetical protein
MSKFPSLQRVLPSDPLADVEFVGTARLEPSGQTTAFDRSQFQVKGMGYDKNAEKKNIY